MSCAMWCADLGITAVVVEPASQLGGQLHRIYNPITNHLGASCSDGDELFVKFLSQVEERDFCLSLGVGIESVDVKDKAVTLFDGRRFVGRFLVVATGVSRRKLGIPGEDEFIGRGILDSGMKARDSVRGKRVLVVGGGDAAVENSLILAKGGAHVTLAHRRWDFSSQGHFLEEASGNPGIDIITGATLEEIRGGASVESVVLKKMDSGASEEFSTDLVLIRIGVEPNTTLMRHTIELDGQGYILTGALQATSEAGVYAIGDVCSPLSPTISSAVGQGALVAKVISRNPLDR